MATDYSKRAQELSDSGEIFRYKDAAPLIGELKKHDYKDDEIKNIIWGIAAESRWKSNAVEKGDSKGGNGLIQLTGDANRKFYSKRLNEYISGNNLNYDRIDLVANRRQLDNDPQMQAVLARMFFDDRKKHLGAKDYTDFRTVHSAFAPKYETAEQRIERLNREGWRKPEDLDIYANTPAIDENEPTLYDSIKERLLKTGDADVPPQDR